MDLSVLARPCLSATLLDGTVGLPSAIECALSFSSRDTIQGGKVLVVQWQPVTGQTLDIGESGGDLTVVQSAGAGILSFYDPSGEPPTIAFETMSYVAIILVADPLAKDAYQNPISASRASSLDAALSVSPGGGFVSSKLTVTTAEQCSFVEKTGMGLADGASIGLSNVTSNAGRVFIVIGGTTL